MRQRWLSLLSNCMVNAFNLVKIIIQAMPFADFYKQLEGWIRYIPNWFYILWVKFICGFSLKQTTQGHTRFLFTIKIAAGSNFLSVFSCHGTIKNRCFVSVVNYGQDWEVGKIMTRTQYRAGIKDEIMTVIEVKIGLRSINITVRGNTNIT